jgi:hypothetical protein
VTVDEGYIKYDIDWTPGPAPDVDTTRELDTWRQRLFAAGLIGEYADLGVGYGNISKRAGAAGQFLISGTQTGHLQTTTAEHYALVTAVDVDANRVSCCGPVKASSEAMTHAAIYALDERIEAVVHVHSKALWDRYIGELPTTDSAIAYGTPGMAREFARLYAECGFDRVGIAIMAGHDEGIVSFGHSLEAAAQRVLSLVPPEEQERVRSGTSGTP